MVIKVDLNQSILAFLDHLRIERGLSENSLKSYGRDLKYFQEFLNSIRRSIAEINSETLKDFEVWLRDRALAISSINSTNSAVKYFLIYCAREYQFNLPTGEII